MIDGIGECKDTIITIPESYNGYTVTAVYMSLNSFVDCTHVTEMILPETLQWFNYNYGVMIREMPNLKFNEYENGKYLGTKNNPYFALIKSEDIYSTEAVIHPDTNIIARQAFANMIKLETVNIPDGVNYIGSKAFGECENLANINIPSSVIAMGEWTFAKCPALKSVTIPGTLKNIPTRMVLDCTALESVTLEEGVEYIGVGAFSGCTALKNINFPSTIKTISMSAFSKCASLTKLELNDGIETIGGSAFDSCENLEEIRIPSSLVYLCTRAFDGCAKLKYNELDNILYLGNSEKPYIALIGPQNSGTLTKANIPETVTAIMYEAFKGCKNLKEVTVPNGVKVLGQNVFMDCTALNTVTLPSSITDIFYWAFKNCSKLNQIDFNGTKEQWENMKSLDPDWPARPQGWAEDSSIRQIYCSDGVITLISDDK